MLDHVDLLNSSDNTTQERNPSDTVHNEMLATYARFYWGLACRDRHPDTNEHAANPQPGDSLAGGGREVD